MAEFRAMAYVPGFEHDVFLSYSHGDDVDWISNFVSRLKPAMKQRLGVDPSIWMDDRKLGRSQDFEQEIPGSLRESAVFLLLPSPSYVRSEYCVRKETKAHFDSVPERRKRFGDEFRTELFAFRCPIMPVDDDGHRDLIPGLSDISFCDAQGTSTIGSPAFEANFGRLVGEIVVLLKRMRNRSTPIFLYPRKPADEIKEAYDLLAHELAAQSYRVLPETYTNLDGQLRNSSLSVFLFGHKYDEEALQLTELAATQTKPWVVWHAPQWNVGGTAVDIDQPGFLRYVEQMQSASKTYLSSNIPAETLKQEVMALLRPDSRVITRANGKPRVYLVYNARDVSEAANAGLIKLHFRKDFQFEMPDDPAQHTSRLTGSDGIVLIWGNAAEDWCAREFAQIAQTVGRRGGQALCVFDPKESKLAALDTIRQSTQQFYIAEQFGPKFDPSRLDPYFDPIRRSAEEK